MKQLISHKLIWLYEEISNLRAGSLGIDILERVAVILCAFMEGTWIGALTNCFPMKNIRKLNIYDWNLTSTLSYMVEDILQWRIVSPQE